MYDQILRYDQARWEEAF